VLIYKLLSVAEWTAAKQAGRFTGSAVDLADGYIHCSTAEQVVETAARHFAGQHGLVLLAVDADRLGDDLRWEPSRGGALFPHLYSFLGTDAVVRETHLAEDVPVDVAVTRALGDA
jgi:uncharacterized protein (DUF952 family)